MTRLTRRKATFILAVTATVSGVLVFALWQEWDPVVVLVCGLAFLVPGRINGHVWRAFYNGRRFADLGHLDGAKAEYNRFLEQVRAHPWRKKLIWFVWSFYTHDVEAMVLNNLGDVSLRKANCLRPKQRFGVRLKSIHIIRSRIEISRSSRSVVATDQWRRRN